MRFGPIVGSLLGAFGGRALGGAVGGNTGRIIGSLAGSLLGSRGLGSLGGLLTGVLGGKKHGNDEQRALAAQSLDEVTESDAEILVKAMCQAAKSDGNVDDAELEAIMGRLREDGEVGEDEQAWVRRELSTPVDLDGLVASVPKGLEQQVYAVSLLAIDSVSGPEASYLANLARGLGLSDDAVGDIKRAVLPQ